MFPKKMPYAGAFAAVAGRSVDIASTYLFVVQMNDPRFTLYGLDAFSFEINPFLGRNPSPKRLIIVGGILTALVGFVGFVFPSVGTAYFLASTFFYSNNANSAVQIATSLALGDEVESQITQGQNREEIQKYLRSVESPDIEKRVGRSLHRSIANYENRELSRA